MTKITSSVVEEDSKKLEEDILNRMYELCNEYLYKCFLPNMPDVVDIGRVLGLEEDLEYLENKWNCKCPECGAKAYQGLGKIECSRKCEE